jgi:CofD-related protein of GAK system
MSTIRVTRSVRIPDPVRISRYHRTPELGPSILFFSGGSALNGISRVLKGFTHNSIHMVTPFDSGGSSAILRQAFGMPSIGDLRSRLMALADESVTGHPDVFRLFTHRFPKDGRQKSLLRELQRMHQSDHPMVAAISNPMRRLIRHQIGYFCEAMPKDFDLRGASIGNLILAGGYLNNHQHLDPIVFLFSKLVGVLGTVRTTVNDDLHLCADLADGSRVVGQHRMTGKETSPLTSPIRKLCLSADRDQFEQAQCNIRKKNRKHIENAELICYPPGSFYSSLLANLLPRGVGTAVAGNDCPKVYIPNLGQDPEQIGMTLEQSVDTLLHYLAADAGKSTATDNLLNFVLMDSKRGAYASPLSVGRMRQLGIQVIDLPLVSKRSAPYYDADLLVAALLSLT